MASDDQKKWLVGGQGGPKRDALEAEAMPAVQRSGTQSKGSHEFPGSPERVGAEAELGNLSGGQMGEESLAAARPRASVSQMTALQSRLAQASQLLPGGAPLGAPPNTDAGEQYLVFSLLECECALKAEHIQGVERLVDVTPVPNVAPWVRGVINLRGSVASVVDLRTFLDMEQLPYNPRTRLLSVQYNEMVICLVVDGVSEMIPIPNTAIAQISTRQTYIPQWALPYAYGSALLDKRAIVLLDAARLLFSDKMQHYSLEL